MADTTLQNRKPFDSHLDPLGLSNDIATFFEAMAEPPNRILRE
jgi:hypothetical protein